MLSRRVKYTIHLVSNVSVFKHNAGEHLSYHKRLFLTQLITVVLTTAGSETTATVLGGTLNYLVSCPDKLELLANEIRGKFPASDDITLDILQHLPYLNSVISEGLRLCPPIPWMLPRIVPGKGEMVCGVWLPGGVRASRILSTIC